MYYIYIMGHITILISVTPSPHPTTHPTAHPNVCYTYHSWHITTVSSSRSVTPIVEPYKNTPSAIHSTVQSVLLVLVVNSGFKLYEVKCPGLARQICPFLMHSCWKLWKARKRFWLRKEANLFHLWRVEWSPSLMQSNLPALLSFMNARFLQVLCHVKLCIPHS